MIREALWLPVNETKLRRATICLDQTRVTNHLDTFLIQEGKVVRQQRTRDENMIESVPRIPVP